MKWGKITSEYEKVKKTAGNFVNAGVSKASNFTNTIFGTGKKNSKTTSNGEPDSMKVQTHAPTYTSGVAAFNAFWRNPIKGAKDVAGLVESGARSGAASVHRMFEKTDPKTGFKLKSNPNASKDDDMKAVNPGFKNFDEGTKYNCMLCTTAYDLRQRGYDVSAGAHYLGYDPSSNPDVLQTGFHTDDITEWYPDAKVETCMGADKTLEALLKQGEGARGNIMVNWMSGGGHSMVYSVEGGKVVIRDCQSGTLYEDPHDILRLASPSISYARLDTAHFNADALRGLIKHSHSDEGVVI